jgi:hypothetical protein
MKIQILNYTFDKTAKTVTFSDYAAIRLDGILFITDVTNNVIIFNFSNPAFGGTVATNVLTLTYNTSALANTDKLLIYYDDANYTVGGSTQDGAVTAGAVGTLSGKLRQISSDISSIKTNTGNIPASPATAGAQSTGNASLSNIDTATAASKTDLDTLAGAVSSSKMATKSADGDFVTLGAKADTAITDSTTTNTHMSFLKGLIKIFADVWDSTNHWLKILRVKKDTFAAPATFTITLASLASSVVGVGRQSTLITGNVAESAHIAVKFTTGTTPTAGSVITVYLIRGDGTLNADNAGGSDAGITIINTDILGTIICSAATSNAAYYGFFDTKFLGSLGQTFGIAIVNSTGATANATSGNFAAEYSLIT